MKNEYCDIQENCKVLQQATVQYEAVVKQNQSLQAELRFTKDNAEKDSQHIRELEEANMLLQEENKKLKNALEKIAGSDLCNRCDGV